MGKPEPSSYRCMVAGTWDAGVIAAVTQRLRAEALARNARAEFVFLLSDHNARSAAAEMSDARVLAADPERNAAAAMGNETGSDGFDAALLWFEKFQPGRIMGLDDEQWSEQLDRNARDSWSVAQACIPLLARRTGAMVVVTSRAATEIVPGGGAFGPAKALELNLVKSIAAEAHPMGVRVNLLSPSPLGAGREPPASFAGAIAFLVGKDADAISATNLTMDAASIGRGSTAQLFGTTLEHSGQTGPAPLFAKRIRTIVTGGAGNIGTETIRALARLASMQGQGGLDAIVADLDEARLAETVPMLRSEGINAVAVVADMNDPLAAGRLIDAALDQFGGLDLVHSNAGYGITDAALAASPEQWSRIVEINLSATWRLAKAAAPHLRASGGSLVATSSIASFLATTRAPMYSASKAALNMLVTQLALEWGADGIRANLVSPGSIDTPMNQLSALPAEDRDKIVSGFPTPRLGRAQEVAEVVAFLASRKASYVTGQNILVDGGLLRSLR